MRWEEGKRRRREKPPVAPTLDLGFLWRVCGYAGTDVRTGEGKGDGSGWAGRVRTKRGRLPTVRNDGNAREGRKGGRGEKPAGKQGLL